MIRLSLKKRFVSYRFRIWHSFCAPDPSVIFCRNQKCTSDELKVWRTRWLFPGAPLTETSSTRLHDYQPHACSPNRNCNGTNERATKIPNEKWTNETGVQHDQEQAEPAALLAAYSASWLWHFKQLRHRFQRGGNSLMSYVRPLLATRRKIQAESLHFPAVPSSSACSLIGTGSAGHTMPGCRNSRRLGRDDSFKPPSTELGAPWLSSCNLRRKWRKLMVNHRARTHVGCAVTTTTYLDFFAAPVASKSNILRASSANNVLTVAFQLKQFFWKSTICSRLTGV